MIKYNFLNLSPTEFEILIKDLLQKREELEFESFKSAADQGIDLRHSINFDNSIIVQCKRYEKFSNLVKELKKEFIKAKLLNPSRYILATSSSLTPKQKYKVKEIFSPYILSYSDILGRDDVNNLISKYEEIEHKHFKLWLSSTNILSRILKANIHNQSNFEEQILRDNINFYVQNSSFNEAIEIVKNNRFVVISGIPGIGKTTLARILVYYYLSQEFEDFIFVSDNINEAYERYTPNKKQIFFYDDFLGRNFLEVKLTKNEDQRIIQFINRIKSSKNKILILTTREYILNQASQIYDLFDTSVEIAKCIIDLSQYTKLVRAKILYNHLYFGKLGKKYFQDILVNNRFLRIVNHPNYNPRLIATITNPNFISNVEPTAYFGHILRSLEEPKIIWQNAFENQISELSRDILLILISCGTPILLDDLQNALIHYYKNNKLVHTQSINYISFKKSLKELENCFIEIIKDSQNKFAIEFQNPSISDFLAFYFLEERGISESIVSTAIYYEQFFRVFQVFRRKSNPSNAKWQSIDTIRKKRILDDFWELSFVNIHRLYIDRPKYKKYQWTKRSLDGLAKIRQLIDDPVLSKDEDIQNFISSYLAVVDIQSVEFQYLSDYFEILKYLNKTTEINVPKMIKSFFARADWVDDFTYFYFINKHFPHEFSEFISKHNLGEEIYEKIEDEVLQCTADYAQDYIDNLEDIENIFKISLTKLKDDLHEQTKTFSSGEENELKKPLDISNENKNCSDEEIINMFESLLE